MKNLIQNSWPGKAILGFALVVGLFFSAKPEAKAYSGVSFQVFYDALTPYGDWVKDARYGYIWLPAVYDDFHPYGTNGRWVMSEYGNTWVSDYDWGWAPFHYGRWYFDDYYQSWAWIPGYEWAPAWVSWRTGGGYYGWAPLSPGVSINVRVNLPSFHWVFLPQARIYHHYPYHYYAPYASRVKIINKTKIINNTVVYNNYNYYGGPSRREVEQVTRKVVPVYNIRSAEAPGRMATSRNEVRMYRPEIEQSRGRTVDARPSRVLDSNEVKTARSSRQVNPSNSGNSSQPSRSANGQSGTVNRSQTPSGRSATPSRNEGFDMKPAPSNGSRTSPSNSGRTAPAQGSRQEQVRTPQSSRENQVRTQPSRESQVRTQPQSAPQRGSVEQRSSAPSRDSQVRQPQQRTQSQPQVRTAPARSSDARVSQPSRTQSSRPEVKSSAPSRKSTSTQSRTSSSSSSRGNSRDKNN